MFAGGANRRRSVPTGAMHDDLDDSAVLDLYLENHGKWRNQANSLEPWRKNGVE
jgi:hypothetical protein